MDKGIRDEHCVKAGCDVSFTTPNYGITTCPSKEFKIVTGEETCPDNEMLDKTGKRVRVIRPLAELKKIKVVLKAKLNDCEILLVVRLAPAPLSHLPVRH